MFLLSMFFKEFLQCVVLFSLFCIFWMLLFKIDPLSLAQMLNFFLQVLGIINNLNMTLHFKKSPYMSHQLKAPGIQN